jgi:hypothetical protein
MLVLRVWTAPDDHDFFAVAFPPLRPAAFFWAVVPPWLELLFELEEFDFFPPRLDAPGEFAIFAARSFDIPLSFSASYCFSFLTFARLPPGNAITLLSRNTTTVVQSPLFSQRKRKHACEKLAYVRSRDDNERHAHSRKTVIH